MRHRPRIHAPFGQAMVEYLVILAFFALVLLMATEGHPSSAWSELVDALTLAYRRISYALSLPT